MLVHGGWIDATSWELVVPAFAEHFQVLEYDRRGHFAGAGGQALGPAAMTRTI